MSSRSGESYSVQRGATLCVSLNNMLRNSVQEVVVRILLLRVQVLLVRVRVLYNTTEPNTTIKSSIQSSTATQHANNERTNERANERTNTPRSNIVPRASRHFRCTYHNIPRASRHFRHSSDTFYCAFGLVILPIDKRISWCSDPKRNFLDMQGSILCVKHEVIRRKEGSCF